MVDGSPGRPLKTIERAFDIVEELHERDGATPMELSESLSMSRSAIYNYLTTLEKRGYLIKEGSTYRPGLRFLHLGESARLRIEGLSPIEKGVGELTRETDEEVDFVVEDHGRVMPIAESYHDLNYYNETTTMPVRRAGVGTYYPMHATASGKALLAEKTREAVDEVIERWGLPELTDNTITEPDRLFEELATVRERGYATTSQEFTDGNNSVAMAVEADGEAIGALAISGPTYRFKDDLVHEYFPSLLSDYVEAIESSIDADRTEEPTMPDSSA